MPPNAPAALRRTPLSSLILLSWAAVFALVMALWPHTISAQSTFPIPGLGSSSADDNAVTPPETAPDATIADPTQALIDILQDDAARADLISRLEQAATNPAPDQAAQATPEPPAAAPTNQTSGHFATKLVETLRTELVEDVRGFFLRLKRVPDTFTLALRGFDADILVSIAKDLALLVLVSYGTLFALRLVVRPLVGNLATRCIGAGWLKRLWFRSIGTILFTLPIPLAGTVAVTVLAFSIDTTEEGVLFSTAQTAYFAAFITVELLKIPSLFLLTPRSKHLRLIPVSDKSARRLQRILGIAIGLAGYGQLVAVPVITEETSVFIGRAVGTVLGSLVIFYMMVLVLQNRKRVADWLRRNREETAKLDEFLAIFSDRWHWPVLGWLIYLLAVVLTRPGNVLGPLVADTLRVLAILGAGSVATMIARRATARRVTLPQAIHSRLPLLAGRLNRLLPAALVLIRIAIVILVGLSVLDVFGAFDLTGFLASETGAVLISGIFGVVLTAVVVSVVYLAMSSWVDYNLNPLVGSAPTPRMVTLLTLLRNAVTIVLVIFAAMFGLSELGLNIGPLLASAGVLGLAISFGAQKLVEDIITGIFIQFENAMNVGDVVDVGGVVGSVEKLTVRSVTLRDVQGVVHMIPFSSASMISNYMREFSYYVCDMGVAYREDIETSKQAMFDAFEELREDPEHRPFILGDLEWFGLNSFGDSAIVLRARVKTQPGKQWGVGRAYNLILKRIFDEREIEIPFPHQTIYFGEDRKGKAPPVHVMMQTASPKDSRAHPVDAPAAVATQDPETLDMPSSDADDPGR